MDLNCIDCAKKTRITNGRQQIQWGDLKNIQTKDGVTNGHIAKKPNKCELDKYLFIKCVRFRSDDIL